MAHPKAGDSSAALKVCSTRKEAVRGVLGQAPRSAGSRQPTIFRGR
jgi:hypothetical protein